MNAPAVSSHLTVEAPLTLLNNAIQEMNAAWAEGRRVGAEEYLARYPALRGDPEAAVRLIYEEICLRQSVGEEDATAEVVARFPEFRTDLDLFFECYRLLGPGEVVPAFPSINEQVDEFHILAELGRGSCGRVYVATQPELADRPVVLKLSGGDGVEHLSLARLQHAHIVPLYLARDFPERRLQGLCMPYLGGMSLANLLNALAGVPDGRRRGQDVLDVLAAQPTPVPLGVAPCGALRQFLARASFSQAVCWMGACLADALQYAHERGLVHFDVKPANVLLAADGQPMLLDFHLAQAPLTTDGPAPSRIGGTPAYMAPEQKEALEDVRNDRPVSAPVDGRTDVYAMGVVLYEALGGPIPRVRTIRPAHQLRHNPQVSPGLAAILTRCMADDPADRYPCAADLAADLRRHLADLPLHGVPDRNLAERWRKWRSRKPGSLTVAGLILTVAVMTAGLARVGIAAVRQPVQQARAELLEGRYQLEHGLHGEAVRTLSRAAARVRGVPFQDDVAAEIGDSLRQARRHESADRLHRLTERLRFLYGAESLPRQQVLRLADHFRACWDDRDLLTDPAPGDADRTLGEQIRTDLRDAVTIWSDLSLRTAPPGDAPRARDTSLRLLRQAEDLFGSDPFLSENRNGLVAGKESDPAGGPSPAGSHLARGRSLLRSGKLAAAAAALNAELAERPGSFWGHFYLGTCYYRMRDWESSLTHFHVCVALAPDCAECYFNRGIAHDSAGRQELALQDYDRALRLDPALAQAALNRGLLRYRAHRLDAAEADVRRALNGGVDPSTAYYDLALIAIARSDVKSAVDYARRALSEDPNNGKARDLSTALQSAVRTTKPPRSPQR